MEIVIITYKSIDGAIWADLLGENIVVVGLDVGKCGKCPFSHNFRIEPVVSNIGRRLNLGHRGIRDGRCLRHE